MYLIDYLMLIGKHKKWLGYLFCKNKKWHLFDTQTHAYCTKFLATTISLTHQERLKREFSPQKKFDRFVFLFGDQVYSFYMKF